MKTIKKLTIGILVFSFLLLNLVVPAFGANAIIAFSSTKPAVGQSVTVTVTINPNVAMYSAEFTVSYNAEILQFNSSDCPTGSAGGGQINAAPTMTGQKSVSYKFNFKAIKAGASTISAAGIAYAQNDDINFGASATMTVSDAAKSGNANLKSLSLSKGTLSPRFSASTTSYTASVANNVTDVKVYAATADSGATVSVSGTSAVNVGKNTRTVTVTAPNGTQKVYTITITRAEAGEDVSSDESSTEETASDTDPLAAEVDGVPYTVLTDLNGITLPNGFTASTTEYNGTTVAVAKDRDENFTVYYLKNNESNTYAPYLLDGEAFKKLDYAAFGNNTYLFTDFPQDTAQPAGYYVSTVELNGSTIPCYRREGTGQSDFYYLYGFFETDFAVYRYDQKENTLQRCPDFRLVPASVTTDDEAKTEKPRNLIGRFMGLTQDARMLVISLALCAIALIVLIVLLILRLPALLQGRKEKRAEEESTLFSGDFEDVIVEDSLTGEEEDASNEPKDE